MQTMIKTALWMAFGPGMGLGAALGIAQTAAAQDVPVVVELYTSQGCSSCPPADDVLADLAGRSDVIALGLHVDYWDYIGWADKFAQHGFTERQHRYAQVAGQRSVYTPQMVVGGAQDVIGSNPAAVAELIRAQKVQGGGVPVTLTRNGGTLTISADAMSGATPEMTVQVVRFVPQQDVAIGRGENGGRTLRYINIVTQWDAIGTWDGTKALSMTKRLAGDEPVAVILQVKGQGPIVGAAQLR